MTEQGKFFCPRCDREYPNLWRMETHVEDAHPDYQIFFDEKLEKELE